MSRIWAGRDGQDHSRKRMGSGCDPRSTHPLKRMVLTLPLNECRHSLFLGYLPAAIEMNPHFLKRGHAFIDFVID